MRVAVVGAGAIGCYFGGMLARAGVSVCLIGRQQHVDAINREGLFIDGVRVRERIRVPASTALDSVRDSQIVLFCVKTVDTESMAHALEPHLAPGGTLFSFQNGVDNVDRIYSATKIEAISTVVYVASAMAGPGHVKHSGRGDLIMGIPAWQLKVNEQRRVDLQPTATMFENAGIPCRLSSAIETELWTKMIINCAYNGISALGRSQYGRIVKFKPARDLVERIVEETVAVARAEGVSLSTGALIADTFKLADAMPSATSSTAQDINRGKPTEIDSLNGYVVRMGAKHGIPTPVNHVVHTLVKLLEQGS
jgi:2-dehydropantoate 2-reductase